MTEAYGSAAALGTGGPGGMGRTAAVARTAGWRERLCAGAAWITVCAALLGGGMQQARADNDRDVRFVWGIMDHEREPGKAQAALEAAARDWQHRLPDAQQLARWSQALTQALRTHGYPIAQVVLTQADAQTAAHTGELRFTVFLGAIGKLDLRNASRVNEGRLRRTITHALCEPGYPVGGGCVLETARLERATQLLQDIPGVALTGAPQLDSQEVGPGQTHLSVVTDKSGRPWSADATVDNQGSESTGIYRAGLIGSGNNLLGIGDAYSASLYTTTRRMWSGAFGASAPLGYDGLRGSFAAGRSLYTINQGVQVNAVGDSVSMGLVYPFVRGLDLNVNGALDGVYTRTHTEYPEFAFSTHTRLQAMRVTLSGNNGDRAQQLGLSRWLGSVVLTTGNQSNDDFQDEGPHRAGHYTKLAATFVRKQNLNEAGSVFAVANVRGQLASKNLDYSEMLGIGGLGGARAYRPDEGSVNQGVIASLDLKWRLPAPWGGQFLPGVLADVALGQVNRDPWPGWQDGYPGVSNVSNRRLLADYGVSLDWVTAQGFTTSMVLARRFGFSQESWVKPGSANLRFWLTFSWHR